MRKETSLVWCALATIATLSACSHGGGGGGFVYDFSVGGSGDGGMKMKGPDMATRQYPQGSTGNQPGDIFPNMTLSGYRLSTTQTDYTQLQWATDIKVEEYFNLPSCKCMLLTMGATWCGACNQEQPALVQDVGGDPSFCVLNILQEGPTNGVNATQSDVDAWAARYSQNFYVTQGTSATRNLWQGYGTTIGLPFNLIIRTSDMKIMDATQPPLNQPNGAVEGFDPNIKSDALALCNNSP